MSHEVICLIEQEPECESERGRKFQAAAGRWRLELRNAETKALHAACINHTPQKCLEWAISSCLGWPDPAEQKEAIKSILETSRRFFP